QSGAAIGRSTRRLRRSFATGLGVCRLRDIVVTSALAKRRDTMTNVDRVGIVAKSNLRQATPHLVDIEAWLRARGREPLFETSTAALMPARPDRGTADKAALVRQVDLVVVLGGDGTLLSVADCVAAGGGGRPGLVVHSGQLGLP